MKYYERLDSQKQNYQFKFYDKHKIIINEKIWEITQYGLVMCMESN